ncbi:AraC-like DNA-binding protein [Anseongella ginsenosidimutans]|uniref:AraC-like DNA-binding protein n=1 Tax=Anseongella ginsenosidimutans TaxID=496056 RepID=A0A4R3KWV0_9SPHI|nr:AraC family transcriptional regulator [Anseongella ginsenosidimutans]QEC51055.1 helix-turn-helix domain-containing protein [Anseongella ginsenosidimutans]TCS90287.1 AraC-like DNA-binding protein [Anseongella ginsenosidimutans]
MKPHFHKVPVRSSNSFSIRHDNQSNPGIWHYHPELELHYVIRGEGLRFIGDNISNFTAGELILLGENLPHKWTAGEKKPGDGKDDAFEVIVIHFRPDCLGRDLLMLPESILIRKLFEKAGKGMLFGGESRTRLANLMYSALKAEGLDRLIVLLSMLKLMAESAGYEHIASAHAFSPSNESDILRLNKIHEYTLANYRKEISLEEIAALSHLSVTSFCRYFKLMTRKTYLDFLTEIRISHACRLLIEDKLATGVICYECGFHNLSNFFRHFKKVTGLTPLKYKQQYLFSKSAQLA